MLKSPLQHEGIDPRWKKGAMALLLLHGYRAAAATALAYPLALLAGAQGLTHFSQGDALAFQSGGLYFLEILSQTKAMISLAPAAVLGFLAALVGHLVPSWYWLNTVSTPHKDSGSDHTTIWRQAPRDIAALGLLALLTWLLRLLAWLLSFFLALYVFHLSDSSPDERVADLLYWGSFLLLAIPPTLVLSSVEGVAQLSLTRQRRVAQAPSIAVALSHAFGILKERPWAVMGGYTASRALVVLAVALSAAIVPLLQIEQGGTWSTALSFGIHQLTALFSLGCCAFWQWRAALWLKPQPS